MSPHPGPVSQSRVISADPHHVTTPALLSVTLAPLVALAVLAVAVLALAVVAVAVLPLHAAVAVLLP